MNLPLVLDIAIGLIFIYLILSLLASEIQELITTLLQWRALHLRRAIEVLLAGGSEGTQPDEFDHVVNLTNEIYKHPLVNNLNQEARGLLPRFFRQFTWLFSKPLGNKRTGPSYIPAETFATTLLERLKVPSVMQKESESRLEKFGQKQLEDIRNASAVILNVKSLSEEQRLQIANEFKKLEENFREAINRFKAGRASLVTSINQMEEGIDRYIASIRIYLVDQARLQNFTGWMTALKQDVFDLTNKRSVLLRQLKPTLAEILEIIHDKDSETHRGIEGVIETLPPSVQESLSLLAKRAQSKAHQAEQDLDQFRQEVEAWFDRSMDRASGVYKRNAKGVAILIGLTLAFVTNTDTFHIVNRLSKDSSLRSTILSNAGNVVNNVNNQNNQILDAQIDQTANCQPRDQQCIQQRVTRAVENISSLPIGWSTTNTQQQEVEGQGWQAFSFLKRILGWFVSGIAIAMGAPFWFDLLGKVVNVRNAGKPPASSANPQAASGEQVVSPRR
jgi:hypothetical protein